MRSRGWRIRWAGTAVAPGLGVRDLMVPSDAEMMRELERAELRRLEPQPQNVVRVRRAPTVKPPR